NYDLGHPIDFLRFPMRFFDKLRFARLMLMAFGKKNWEDWHDKSAYDLVERYAGSNVREIIFEPLTQLKFNLSTSEVSGAWMGARLHFREGSTPFGYLPGTNWTKALCDGVVRLLEERKVTIRTNAQITGIEKTDDRIQSIQINNEEIIAGDVFVSTIPTNLYARMLPEDNTEHLKELRFTALISVICATDQQIDPDFYWMNLSSLDHTACGVFKLDSLNPEIGIEGDSCINFVTHLNSRDSDIFSLSDEDLVAAYKDDFKRIFGFELKARWFNIERIPEYSPILFTNFQNPAAKSGSFSNTYFAGNYRSFPSIVSTGSALASGVGTGELILQDHSQSSSLMSRIDSFRMPSRKKAG
ncbi:MAG: FAD-dependent oxidoreductase, partial [Gammaproteobacteria bacterium]